MIGLWVPQTKGLTLEGLDYVFTILSAKYIKNQDTEIIVILANGRYHGATTLYPPLFHDFRGTSHLCACISLR
ncbi:hypothetical protein BDV38DRAFT_249275 [Aspergillus pseudotamarii]|uniref:Uncharacterized protein n=1 Tax=Aspergillus pseudotamarii TaxID=132259 RepID=A0A5N6SRK6_ASPPS|nr:uncharacterized protein BDV38DRAFT_249275 [Aspergillus pseudotamarii]KAE8136567.1 hypothetical protein BDV38DRAFT_249275 [Aspergillus pseudotamarii]